MQEKRTVDEEEFNPEEVVTIDVLAQAIANGISRPRMRMSIEEAKLTAEHVLNFFGFYNRIIDNVLEPEDRDTFYMLEDLGILTTEREETTLHDGREWRIHYWILNYKRIKELANRPPEEEIITEEVEDASVVYEELPEEVWAMRSA